MKSMTKKGLIVLLSGISVVCIGGAALATRTADAQVFAAGDVSYEAFVNVGASEAASATDALLGLTQKGAEATAAGAVTAGNTLFGSYATGATYTMTVSDAGTYQIAVALKAEAGKTLKVGGEAVPLTGMSGNTVVKVDKALTGTSVAVEYDGALCGVLVAAQNSKVLMTADYTAGQVISYGAPVEPALENATGYYSDGTTAELDIEYGEINAGTGVNVNFTTIELEGTIIAGDVSIPVTRHVITMPDDLIYFINCGSSTEVEPKWPNDLTAIDQYYDYNQTVFDHFGDQLINNGTPDQQTTQGGDWGIYSDAGKHGHGAANNASFPYNSYEWTGNDFGYHEMGYMLSDLTPGGKYRVWFGTLSHWHARTVNITFNGQTLAGQETLRIPGAKSFSVFENIEADGNGKVDIHMTQVGDQNEPTLCFIAVQNMSTEVAAAAADVKGPSMVGMEDTSITLTGGMTAGATLRLYNEAKPYQLLYEEVVDGAKIAEDGSYIVEWGEVFPVAQFRVVQVTAGGAGAGLLVSITDIEEFSATILTQGYTTGKVVVSVEAQADSGIAQWAYRLGEYGEEHVITLDRPYKLQGTFEAEENGVYYIVVTSGLGVTYSETITVSTIDSAAPTVTLLPSAAGWKKGEYHVSLEVNAVAPVTEYRLYMDGKEINSAAEAPAAVTFTKTGEYTVSVTTAAGQTATSSLRVSDDPVTTVVRKSYDRRQLRYSFGDSANYVVYSVTAYQLMEDGISKMTIADGNVMDVYDPGMYVITVLTADGSTEMFALNVEKSDFSANNVGVVAGGGGSDNTLALGVGLGVGLGGLVLAAAAVIVTVIVTKKKS